jgi:hypothetical protein
MTPEEMAVYLEACLDYSASGFKADLLKEPHVPPIFLGVVNYRYVGRLLELMKSRARRSLQTKRAA